MSNSSDKNEGDLQNSENEFIHGQELSTCAAANVSEDCQVAEVKSSAIVKCTAIEAPSCFQKLSSNTNLNQPPANWLKSSTKWQGRFGQWAYPKKNSAMFSSFKMANTFTDCIGEVDVISDAENIKKLLKIPYSKAHISMMVHRVGKTILLDEFDIHRHLLRASQKQWEWLRKFYYDHILESFPEKEKCMLRKSKAREKLQNKNMFSKFLYYSLPDPQSKHEVPSEMTDAKVCNDSGIHEDAKSCDDTPLQLFSWNTPTIPDPTVENEDPDLDDTHEFLRKVLWTFEDIRMLVGSDMPIFGGGTRPAVSLRLRDMHKPINVLTGLDYWLDNLMCNVPEVMMCYHLDGIVQKYEVIKTEDIPYLKHSQFSPKLVKDIAQNILSFLKSNATKSGHTYWLFKGKDDDVVKLYDLTTLCADMMDEKEQNPFAFPVAMLLYRVARNMKESSDSHRKQGTILKLLKNCILLLDPQKHPQIVTSAHYLLADLFVPNNADTPYSNTSTDLLENEGETENEDEAFEEDLSEKFDLDEHGHPASPSVEVKALCYPTTYREDTISDVEKISQVIDKNFDQKCHEAIDHITQGLSCVLSDLESSVSEAFKEPKQSSSHQEEEVKMAKPFEAIPLHYASLQKDSESGSTGKEPNFTDDVSKVAKTQLKQRGCDTCFCESKAHAVTAITSNIDPSWKECCKILLLLKATQVYGALSESANSSNKFGLALKYIKLGILCYNSAQAVIVSHGTKCQTDPLAFLLSLSGDIHLMVVHGDQSVHREYHKEQYDFVSEADQKMLQLLQEVSDGHESDDFEWVYEWTSTLETSLLTSFRCYQMARQMWPESRKDGWIRLTRRIGNVCNELGVFYMSQVTRMWNEAAENMKGNLEVLWKKSLSYLEDGIVSFNEVNDANNIALLHSNVGRLMRICAHLHGITPSDGSCREFCSQERYYYNKAIQSYQKALHVLGQRRNSPDVWDTVTWELSTTFYNMGCLLQDYAPLSTMAQEKIEKEVTEIMFKALKLCDSETSSSRQPLYSYRMASIHHRLGSLYHHACRNHLCSGEKQKQLRTLAERHYSKACELYDTLENNTDFLRALLERIGMWEHQVAGLSGFSSKLKTLHSLLELAVSAESALNRIICSKNLTAKTSLQTTGATDGTAKDGEDEEDANEQKELLNLFHNRLQFNIERVVKVYSSKMAKFENVFKRWKDLLSKASQDVEAESFEIHLLSVLQDIKGLIAKK